MFAIENVDNSLLILMFVNIWCLKNDPSFKYDFMIWLQNALTYFSNVQNIFYFKISKYYTFIAQQFTKQYITIVYKSQYIMPKYVFYQHRNCFRVRRKWLKDKNEKLTIQTSCLIGKILISILLRSLWGCSFSQTILPHTL